MKRLQSDKIDRREVVIRVAAALAWNCVAYSGARLIAQSWHHYDMTTAVDNRIPLIPGTITIYFGCYLFWGINYFLSAMQERQECDRFFCADMLAKAV